MTQTQTSFRAGFYAGYATHALQDSSWARRLGTSETLTEKEYEKMVTEITERLISAGKLTKGVDLWEHEVGKSTTSKARG